MPYDDFLTYSCITYYELFKLSKLLGGGGQNDMFAPPPHIFIGGRLPPPPPGSTPLLQNYQHWSYQKIIFSTAIDMLE